MSRFAVVMLGVLICLPSHAQQEDKRAKEALRRLQQQQREFNDQKAKLEQDKAKAEKDLADKDRQAKQLQARIKKAEAGAKEAEIELKQKSAQIEALHAELEAANVKFVEARERGDKLADSLKATQETVRQRDGEKEVLAGRIATQREIIGRQSQLVQACDDKNAQLYKVGNELLDRYRDKNVMDALKQAEPFTQIERVRVENLWQEYRDKLDAQKSQKAVLAR